MKVQRQFKGSSLVYDGEMDGGQEAIDRAYRRAWLDADNTITGGTWEAVDSHVHRVVEFGTTKYVVTLTVEVDNG